MILNTKTRIGAILIATVMIATPAFAETPAQNFENIPSNLIYEGRILSSTGEKLEGSYVARFSFWNNSDFTDSSVLSDGTINPEGLGFSGWTEVTPLVFNDLGHFSVVLGENTSLSNLQFTEFKYLQVEIKKSEEDDSAYQLIDINGDNGADTNDRKLIASVPYAIHSYTSKNADSAETAQGASDANFILDTNNTAGNEANNVSAISLQFGNSLDAELNKKIAYDLTTQTFNFDTSVNIAGDITTTGLINGVNIPELNTHVQNLTTLQNAPSFIIDPNNENTENDLSLQFGGLLAETLTWSRAEEQFSLSDDIFVSGDITLSGLVDGVDVASLQNIVTQSQTDIVKNASDILKNLNDTIDIKTILTTAEQNIVKNAEEILTNKNTITQNTADISTIKTTLTTAEQNIIKNAEEILTNKNLLTTAQAEILTNARKIDINTADILKNVQDILLNTNDIAALNTKLTQAEQYIVNNAAKITQNTDKITTAQADIITNAGDILKNYNLITQSQADILKNTQDITTNSENIEGNTLNIVQNAQKITDLENRTLVAESKIIKNSTDIAENIAKITAHEQDITNLENEIAELRTLIGTTSENTTNYDAEITNLQNAIATHTTDITNLQTDIANLKAEIENNTTNILTNATAINSITNTLSTAEDNIVKNAQDILSNATDITQAQKDIITNATAILAQNTLITQAQQDILNNSSDITALQTKVTNLENKTNALETQLTTAEGDILQNAQDILSNATDITQAQQDIINNAAAIVKNANDISNLEGRVTATENAINTVSTLVGNGDFTGAKYITFGKSLTNAITELDIALAGIQTVVTENANNIDALKTNIDTLSAPTHITQAVEIGTGVVSLDGTDNAINVYTSREQGVENPHHFYKIYSKQNTLQDIDLQFKVLLPENFTSFEGYTFSYQTDGTVADSAVNIELKDAQGNIASSAQNLTSSAWTTTTDTTLNSVFAPQAGEYVYITFKAFSQQNNQVKIGDITVHYTTQ